MDAIVIARKSLNIKLKIRAIDNFVSGKYVKLVHVQNQITRQ